MGFPNQRGQQSRVDALGFRQLAEEAPVFLKQSGRVQRAIRIDEPGCEGRLCVAFTAGHLQRLQHGVPVQTQRLTDDERQAAAARNWRKRFRVERPVHRR
jgi:hypothetical protein